ncbi:caspase-14-like isoform X2 [Dysidea avara]|uniref:caspase-14-like isoform X2 n=1 Tax=Dysidea avara TaxID=196820 RepID=UPI00332BC74D
MASNETVADDPYFGVTRLEKPPNSLPPLKLQPTDQTDTPDGAPNTNQLPGVNHASKNPKYQGNEQIPPEKQDASDGDGLQVYKMDSAHRGLGIIINIKEVKDKTPRKGAEKDGETLKKLFDYLGFTVRLHDKGLTAEEMKKTLNDVAKELNGVKGKYDCLLVAILTHGEKMELLHGADGETVSVTDLIKLFDGGNCEALFSKPKVFFVQACRGTECDRGKDAPDGDQPRDEYQKNETDETDSGGITLPTMSDYLVAFATDHNRPAFRNTEKGSYFIVELNEVFKKMAEKEQLIDMLTEVNRKIAEGTYDGGKFKQQPHFVSALRKKLYLHPVSQKDQTDGLLQSVPKMLNLMKIVTPKIQDCWDDVAFGLGYENDTVKNIKAKHQDPKKCCKMLFMDWLTPDKTWAILLDAIKEVDDIYDTAIREEIIQDIKEIK